MITPGFIKERGILFKDRLVLALLEGRKTQTRRIAKLKAHDGLQADHSPWRYCERSVDGDHLWQHKVDIRRMIVERCPYGVAGDRLWVRETWAPFYAPGSGLAYPEPDMTEANAIRYRATPDHVHAYPTSMSPFETRPTSKREHVWRPSIFMPRWASRIALEITAVRVQRLSAITDEDAVAEGVQSSPRDSGGVWWLGAVHRVKEKGFTVHNDPRTAFLSLFASINGRAVVDADPWLWALTFKRIDMGVVTTYRDTPAPTGTPTNDDNVSRAAAEDIISDLNELIRAAEGRADDDDI